MLCLLQCPFSVQGVRLLPEVSLSRPWLLLVNSHAAALARPGRSG